MPMRRSVRRAATRLRRPARPGASGSPSLARRRPRPRRRSLARWWMRCRPRGSARPTAMTSRRARRRAGGPGQRRRRLIRPQRRRMRPNQAQQSMPRRHANRGSPLAQGVRATQSRSRRRRRSQRQTAREAVGARGMEAPARRRRTRPPPLSGRMLSRLAISLCSVHLMPQVIACAVQHQDVC